MLKKSVDRIFQICIMIIMNEKKNKVKRVDIKKILADPKKKKDLIDRAVKSSRFFA
jgi:hypothetical protein